jgi:hypothetical protein
VFVEWPFSRRGSCVEIWVFWRQGTVEFL